MVKRLVGKNIKRIRNIKGFTQSYVTQRLGYKSPSILCEIESGKKGFDADKIPLLASILEVEIVELYEDDIHNMRIQSA